MILKTLDFNRRCFKRCVFDGFDHLCLKRLSNFIYNFCFDNSILRDSGLTETEGLCCSCEILNVQTVHENTIKECLSVCG